MTYEEALKHFGLTDTGKPGDPMFGCGEVPLFLDARGVTHPGVIGYAGGRLGFCGCGSPEQVLVLVRDVLAMHPMSDHQADSAAYFEHRGGDAVLGLVLYVLDDKGLTEHGGTVFGGWLTKDGEALLALLNERFPVAAPTTAEDTP